MGTSGLPGMPSMPPGSTAGATTTTSAGSPQSPATTTTASSGETTTTTTTGTPQAQTPGGFDPTTNMMSQLFSMMAQGNAVSQNICCESN